MKVVLDLRDKEVRTKIIEAYIEKEFGKEFVVTHLGYEGVRRFGEEYMNELVAVIERVKK